jgi:ABC-2 type transport system ATP-binding protein
MIEAHGLRKEYGEKVAVDDLTFTVQPGQVTGFLGPNGAGKSTTMRMIVGLDRPTRGDVLVNGKPFAEHDRPLQEVGALLEARSTHPGRSARSHLLAMAATAGIGRARVDEVLERVGLSGEARQPAGSFSLGMGQRLGLAAALLADPATLILDEPVNGLDLDGIRWIRGLLSELAAEGRTVFLSSHLMSEMSLVAHHVIVIGHGRILRDQPMAQLIAESSTNRVRVRAPEASRLAAALVGQTVTIHRLGDSVLEVEGASSEEIGTLAGREGVVLHELSVQGASLEEAYLALTEGEVEHRGGQFARRAHDDTEQAQASRNPAQRGNSQRGDAA